MRSAKEVEQRLKSVPLFQGLTRNEIKAVARDVHEQRFAPGDVIVSEGEKGGRFFVIMEGRASLERDGRRAKGYGPGTFFGEMSLLDGEPRSATVVAQTPVNVLSISSWNFLALLEENWNITKKVLAELSRRVRTANATGTD